MENSIGTIILDLSYLISAIMFVVGLKLMSHPKSSKKGNLWAATGMVLAMARGAGEVAPLMLVGAVKLAPELALDGVVPFIHPERSFMHLGFHIFDVGFQSQNSEAAKPMVYTTTLLLIAIIAFLNLAAVRLRTRLRRRFASSGF